MSAERVAIVGSRNYPNREQVVDFVRQLPEETIVVSGGAAGVDTWAEQAARRRGLGVLVFCVAEGQPNRWSFREAAFLRNARIVAESDRVVAFWDGRSSGTHNSIQQAARMLKPTTIYTPQWVEEMEPFNLSQYNRLLRQLTGSK